MQGGRSTRFQGHGRAPTQKRAGAAAARPTRPRARCKAIGRGRGGSRARAPAKGSPLSPARPTPLSAMTSPGVPRGKAPESGARGLPSAPAGPPANHEPRRLSQAAAAAAAAGPPRGRGGGAGGARGRVRSCGEMLCFAAPPGGYGAARAGGRAGNGRRKVAATARGCPGGEDRAFTRMYTCMYTHVLPHA